MWKTRFAKSAQDRMRSCADSSPLRFIGHRLTTRQRRGVLTEPFRVSFTARLCRSSANSGSFTTCVASPRGYDKGSECPDAGEQGDQSSKPAETEAGPRNDLIIPSKAFPFAHGCPEARPGPVGLCLLRALRPVWPSILSKALRSVVRPIDRHSDWANS
jgi:hypothetical protein